MIKYKYTDITNLVVAKIDDDGISRMSCSIEHPEYLAWLEEGNTPEPADPLPPVIVTVVTMRQARLALLQSSLLSQVEAAIAAIEDTAQRQAVQIEWEYAAEVNRTHPWVQHLATALGLTEAQLDDLFTLAATL